MDFDKCQNYMAIGDRPIMQIANRIKGCAIVYAYFTGRAIHFVYGRFNDKDDRSMTLVREIDRVICERIHLLAHNEQAICDLAPGWRLEREIITEKPQREHIYVSNVSPAGFGQLISGLSVSIKGIKIPDAPSCDKPIKVAYILQLPRSNGIDTYLDCSWLTFA